MTDANLLAARVTADLPPASTWTMPPRGYRQSLALCLIDGVARQVDGDDRTDALIAQSRASLGDDAESAGLDALADSRLADTVGHTAASSLIAAASHLLRDDGVLSTTHLVERLKSESLSGPLGAAWMATSGLTRRMWTDTAMLAGYLDPDVDRVISAYVSRAIGADPSTTPADRVIAALTEVAARFESSILPLEFAILNHERS